MLLCCQLNLLLHLLKVVGDEDATALAASFWLGNVKHRWRLISLFLGHLARTNLLLALVQALSIVLDYLMQVLRVQPGSGKELVLIGELFEEALKVD